jgi:ABC-2 type transport system ATP-binding protein
MEMTRKNIIRTSGLSKSFGDVGALKSLDLAVPENSIVGFLGPNGAGKTTTIRLLLGLNKPTSGTGEIFGHDIVKDSLEIRKRVGYLAQNQQFYDDMTAREILRFTANFFFKGPKAKIEASIKELLELVGLQEKADRRIKGFSGGERQRLGIAQAQINEPDLLILDEPAASLDPMGRQAVLEIMESLRERATIFYSTHILDDVQKVSDRVVILNQGCLITQGPIDALLLGDEGTVYRLITVGEADSIEEKLSAEPWVNKIQRTAFDGRTSWRIAVKDDKLAQVLILRKVLQEDTINVLEFGQEKLELEQIFMHLVKEEERWTG